MKESEDVDEWGTTAEELLEQFGDTEAKLQSLREIREQFWENRKIREEARRLADQCKLFGTIFLTALAVLKKEPERLHEIAEALERLTPDSTPAFRKAEIEYVEVRLQELLKMVPP